jgi:hypothetical protein
LVRTLRGLSIFAGAISIFWLAILGDWGPILYGIALLIAGARFLHAHPVDTQNYYSL